MKHRTSKSGWDFPRKKLPKKEFASTWHGLEQLINLKLQIDSMKSVYAAYDELLQELIESGRALDMPREISINGSTWNIEITNAFAKNTAWKSTPFRQYDLTLTRQRKI